VSHLGVEEVPFSSHESHESDGISKVLTRVEAPSEAVGKGAGEGAGEDADEGLSLASRPKKAHEASTGSKRCSMQSASCSQMYWQSLLVALRPLYQEFIPVFVL
jgi:hypothetical protein